MDVIIVDPRMLWGTDDVWVGVIMVLAHGCTGERMRSGWTLSWLWPMGALKTDEVRVHVIMVLAHGCCGGRIRSG